MECFQVFFSIYCRLEYPYSFSNPSGGFIRTKTIIAGVIDFADMCHEQGCVVGSRHQYPMSGKIWASGAIR